MIQPIEESARDGMLRQLGQFYLLISITLLLLPACSTHTSRDALADGDYSGYTYSALSQKIMSHPRTRSQGALSSLVAHAGDEVKGMAYTNSLESLNVNHEAGHRLFELDFEWTADDSLVFIHDWDRNWVQLFLGREGVRPLLRDFRDAHMRHGLHQLDVVSLMDWLHSHPEAKIVTDIKDRNTEGLSRLASSGIDITQLIPQVYNTKEYEVVDAMGYGTIFFTLYRTYESNLTILKFVLKTEGSLKGMVMWPDRAKQAGFGTLLDHLGQRVYIHTLNDTDQMIESRAFGVSGWYTDRVTHNDLKEASLHHRGG